MKLRKIFKYGFLAICLLGNVIAMDSGDDKSPYGNNFPPKWTGDVSRVIVSHLTYRHWPDLASTCKAWQRLIENYSTSTLPSMIYEKEKINLNLHPNFDGEVFNRGCTASGSLCIFLPFQKGLLTEKVDTWEQTTGYCINGYTGEVVQLTPFEGRLDACYPHPQGFYCDRYLLQLITITDTIIQTQLLLSPNINLKPNSNFHCNNSYIVTTDYLEYELGYEPHLLCYSLDGNQKRTTKLENSLPFLTPCYFGNKFLVFSRSEKSIYVIDPELEDLVEKKIDVSSQFKKVNKFDLRNNTHAQFDLKSDEGSDSVVIGMNNLWWPSLYGNYNSGYFYNDLHNTFYLVTNISSSQPTTTPISFLPKGSQPVEFFLKNNYIFSIASLTDNEAVHDKSGALFIYDVINRTTCFQKFFPGIPCHANLAGNTIFVEGITSSKQYSCEEVSCKNEDCPKSHQVDTKSLLSFNIKHFLS